MTLFYPAMGYYEFWGAEELLRFWICWLPKKPFALWLQQFGTRTCHFAWYWLHFGMSLCMLHGFCHILALQPLICMVVFATFCYFKLQTFMWVSVRVSLKVSFMVSSVFHLWFLQCFIYGFFRVHLWFHLVFPLSLSLSLHRRLCEISNHADGEQC